MRTNWIGLNLSEQMEDHVSFQFMLGFGTYARAENKMEHIVARCNLWNSDATISPFVAIIMVSGIKDQVKYLRFCLEGRCGDGTWAMMFTHCEN